MVNVGLWFDFRNPVSAGRQLSDVYANAFEHIRNAEQLGYAEVWTTEHHFIDDDYSSSLMPICAAIGAMTTRVRIGTAVLLLPFHDPVRLAEDAATVDIISGGRLDLGVGVGYRVGEFESFGIDFHTRGRRMSEASQVLTHAWLPGAFSHHGEFYNYDDIDVRPKPLQDPMPLWFGGLTPPAARRAARFGTGFIAGAGPSVIEDYAGACAKHGKPIGRICKGLGFSAVAKDPDAAWAELRDSIFYQRRRYAEWLTEAGSGNVWPVPETPEAIRDAEPDIVVTPERALQIASDVISEDSRITDMYWHPQPPGLSDRVAAESIDLFAREVLPHLP
jgi:alkanesulfonate monooxygenase SsuD/methylene tetrahydromethanopterin reductase-like flavin-dependent oxidoreductase (luciferase family)